MSHQHHGFKPEPPPFVKTFLGGVKKNLTSRKKYNKLCEKFNRSRKGAEIMSRLSKAYIPYKGYYSTPFCRWQGSLANENAVILAGATANRWFKERKIDPTI